MHRVLPVQCVGGLGHAYAQGGNHRGVQRGVVLHPMLQGAALHIFHYQIGHALQIARRDKARHMRAAQGLQDVALHLKAHDVFCAVAAGHTRYFHGHRKAGVGAAIGIADAVNMRHAAAVQAAIDSETV